MSSKLYSHLTSNSWFWVLNDKYIHASIRNYMKQTPAEERNTVFGWIICINMFKARQHRGRDRGVGGGTGNTTSWLWLCEDISEVEHLARERQAAFKRNGMVEEQPHSVLILSVDQIDCLYFCGWNHTRGRCCFHQETHREMSPAH